MAKRPNSPKPSASFAKTPSLSAPASANSADNSGGPHSAAAGERGAHAGDVEPKSIVTDAMIAEAAYFRWLACGGSSEENWCEARAELTARMTNHQPDQQS
jgi:hypothetical protein